MDVSTALTAVSAAIKFAKDLSEIQGHIDQATLKLKVAELTAALADAKMAIVETGNEIQNLEQKISGLEKQFAYRAEKTVQLNGWTYEADADGKPQGMPFCTVCEQQGVLVRLAALFKEGRPHVCPHCKGDFGHVTEYLWENQRRK